MKNRTHAALAGDLLLTALATWVQRRYVGERKPLEVLLVAAGTDMSTGLDQSSASRA